MKLDALIETGTKELGLRFALTNLLPLTVLFVVVLVHVWSGAPWQAPDPAAVVREAQALSTGDSLLLVVAILVLALVLQPLHLALVKVLEGYWGRGRLGEHLARPGVALHRARRARLRAATQLRVEADGAPTAGPSPQALARMAAAAWRLERFYPAEDRLLPTTLGNVLRAAEDRAGSRYGLDAVAAWPRLYPLLPDPVQRVLADQRNQMDAAARFCIVFALAGVLSALFLYRYGAWLLVPLGLSGLAFLAYRAAVAAALAYGESLQVAFDLHRFDLLRALHLPLPADYHAEVEANRVLSHFLRQPSFFASPGWGPGFTYAHGGEDVGTPPPSPPEERATTAPASAPASAPACVASTSPPSSA